MVLFSKASFAASTKYLTVQDSYLYMYRVNVFETPYSFIKAVNESYNLQLLCIKMGASTLAWEPIDPVRLALLYPPFHSNKHG